MIVSTPTAITNAPKPIPSPGNILLMFEARLMPGARLHASRRSQGSFVGTNRPPGDDDILDRLAHAVDTMSLLPSLLGPPPTLNTFQNSLSMYRNHLQPSAIPGPYAKYLQDSAGNSRGRWKNHNQRWENRRGPSRGFRGRGRGRGRGQGSVLSRDLDMWKPAIPRLVTPKEIEQWRLDRKRNFPRSSVSKVKGGLEALGEYESDSDCNEDTAQHSVVEKVQPPAPVKEVSSRSNRKRFITKQPTLLQKLLDNEIRRQRNILLQCIKYIVEKKMILED
ncbi:uncharacterized protein [Oscarella lobularis]|uniref:uncharacterized protein n=1 Tax=Oscarella lobularis TaxID=121494 RepID=UPI00331434F7